jgi:hypothetical protein
MKDIKNFTNQALKYCRYWQIFVKIIIIILLSVFIYMNYEDNIHHTTISAKVIKANCKENVKVVQGRYSSHNELYNDCQLNIEYNINNKIYQNKLRTIEYKYYDGDEIWIDYENKNINNIRLHDITNKIIFYGCIVVLITLLFILYVVIFHQDKKWVKWLIGILCIRSLTN